MLRCPVRACCLALEREGRRLVCARGHAFDVARSGYVNLLQPQERRSKQPGDTEAAVAARRRLHERGLTAELLCEIASFAQLTADDSVLDAGCGEGFYLGSMARSSGCTSSGIDISIPAIELAARSYPDSQWIVGNADRDLPYLNGVFSVVLSITARRNATEFRRVLRDDGRLIVAVPSQEDLIELRGRGRDRVERTIAEFTGEFELREQTRSTAWAELDTSSVEDLLLSIYRPFSRTTAIPSRVTFSFDLLKFACKPRSVTSGQMGICSG